MNFVTKNFAESPECSDLDGVPHHKGALLFREKYLHREMSVPSLIS